jgi:hypothetical protein
MNSAKQQVEMFNLSLGRSPGGHPRAYNWWLDIASLAAAELHFPDPNDYDDSIEQLDLNRVGFLALAMYACLKDDFKLLLNVSVAGAAREAEYIAQGLTREPPHGNVEE